jgi:hypothetical protein
MRRLLCWLGWHTGKVPCASVVGDRCWICGKLWPLTRRKEFYP